MMNPHGPSPISGGEFKKGIWRTGKEESKRFLNIPIGKKKEITSYIYGLLLAAAILAPFVLLAYQVFDLYKYSLSIIVAFLVFVWVALILFSALSNWITVLIVKAWLPEDVEVQKTNTSAIFVYQLLNPGFAAFALIIIMIFVFAALNG